VGAERPGVGRVLAPWARVGPAALAGLAALVGSGCGGEDSASARRAAAPTSVALARADAFLDELRAVRVLDHASSGWRLRFPRPPTLPFEPGERYLWVIETDLGTLRVLLHAEVAPRHVSSVISLTRAGFYDGLTFHRVVQGFMAQGGDPLGTGKGGPGYTVPGEVRPSMRHDRRGLVAAAHRGSPDTAGSQFYVTLGPAPHLDGHYTIFGEVVAGTRVLDEFDRWGAAPMSAVDAPLRTIRILRALIEVE
jgi:cyclophilin family peptidyl-prolyl cis-trans isomerase